MTKMAALQNGRIFRFLIVIVAVVLTIFIYASYYSNTSMTIPSHMRASPSLASSSSSMASDNSNPNHNVINNLSNTNGIVVVNNIQNSDSNADNSESKGGNSNIMVEIRNIDSNFNNLNDRLRYIHQSNSGTGGVDSTGGSTSGSSSSSNGNKTSTDAEQKSNERHSSIYINSSLVVQDSDSLLIPTSNIQTFILNADKILKNLTTLPSNAPPPPPPPPPAQQQNAFFPAITKKDIQSQVPQLPAISNRNKPSFTSPQSSVAQPPSALIPANRIRTSVSGSSAALQSVASVIIDPTQGIPTRQIYESGHLDVNPQLCPDEGESIKLLIIITSAQPHQDARLSIRQTWGHYGTRRDVAIAFILGRTNNQTLENALNHENYIYGDLIRGHFVDSYNNLTLKTISALEWVDHNCPLANFVLKTDDDMFINVPKLMAFIDKHQRDKRVIYGRLAKKWKPIRNKKSKYYVSTGQFSATIFPPFTTGPAYVMSADIVHDLYVKSLQQTYLKLEDVFTTGIVAQQLGIKRIHVNEFLNRRIAFNPCNIRKTISVHMIKSNEQFDLWKKLLDQTTKCK